VILIAQILFALWLWHLYKYGLLAGFHDRYGTSWIPDVVAGAIFGTVAFWPQLRTLLA
jgi:hypothetical protein